MSSFNAPRSSTSATPTSSRSRVSEPSHFALKFSQPEIPQQKSPIVNSPIRIDRSTTETRMSCLALALQPVNGPNILLQTREWFPPSRALVETCRSFVKKRQHSAAISLGDDSLDASSSQVIFGAESRYCIVYGLVNSIYVLGVLELLEASEPPPVTVAKGGDGDKIEDILVKKTEMKGPEMYVVERGLGNHYLLERG